MIIEQDPPSLPLPPPANPSATSLSHLPNEVLLTILTPFSTPTLLPLISISHRFAHLTLRLLHHRLVISSNLSGSRSIQLECYRPLDRLSAETLLCSPLGTEGLDPPNSNTNIIDQLRKYNSCFTRFQPYRKGTSRVRPRRHPAGDVPGTRTYSGETEQQGEGSAQASNAIPEEELEEEMLPPIKQPVNLDAHEVFTQLQTTASIVTAGPKSGFVYSAVTASEGVLRVFRAWLSEQNERRIREEQRGVKRGDGKPVPLTDSSILWVNDQYSNVGVRFIVAERQWRRNMPILMRADEDVAVHYEVQIEEVVVRTRHLLLKTEQGLQEKMNAVGGKAIVIGKWEG